MIMEPSKQAFRNTWPGGYMENFVVYEEKTGGKESEIVANCITPFIVSPGTALEVGCGSGFWLNGYLLPHFERVIGIDVIPREWVQVSSERFTYIEVPDRNYNCHGIDDSSIDFVWSFGCFCHLPIHAVGRYLESIVRVLKPSAKAALFFSNTERRPKSGTKTHAEFDPSTQIIWCDNNWCLTHQLMEKAGFRNILDLMPDLKDTMAYGEK